MMTPRRGILLVAKAIRPLLFVSQPTTTPRPGNEWGALVPEPDMPSWWQPQAEPLGALRHAVSHAVIPQLLRPMVAAAMPAPLLLDERDAVMCLTVLKCPNNLTGTGIGAVARLQQLQSLEITWCHYFDGAALEYLTELPCLTLLNLTGSRDVNATTLRFVVDMPVLRTLQISECRSIDAAAVAVAIKAPRLRNLELGEWVMKDECFVAAAAAAHLEALSVHHIRRIQEHTLLPLVGALPALRILSFDRCDAIHVATVLECAVRMDFLHTLSFRGCHLSDHSAFARLRDLKHLRRFTFSGPGGAIAHVAPLKELTSLEVYDCEGIVNGDLVHVAGLRRLDKLVLHTCEAVSASGLRHLSHLHRLRDITLAFCPRVDAVAVAILAELRSIETVVLRGCKFVDAATVAPLLAVPGLRHLDLTLCRLITEAAVAEMQWAAPRISFRRGSSSRPLEPFFS